METTAAGAKNPVYGVLHAVAAFVIWGFLPLYWYALRDVTPLEILMHRIIWSAAALFLFFFSRGMVMRSFKLVMSNRRTLLLLLLSGALISVNWFAYIWAIANGHVLETSLGYFINPILSVLLGFLVLGERLNRVQWIAVGLVCLSLMFGIINNGEFPWLALFLAVTFGFYGLLKKTAGVDSLVSLWFETGVCMIPASLFLAMQVYEGSSAFGHADFSTHLLLIGSGILTAAPLLFFGWATRHLNLATVGFMQFIAPSIQFLLGIFFFHETLNASRLAMFVMVWIAVVLYLMGPHLTRSIKLVSVNIGSYRRS